MASDIHGGKIIMTWTQHFEAVWKAEQVIVYLYDIDPKPLPAKGGSGEAACKFKNRPEQKATLTTVEAGKRPADFIASAGSV